MAADAVGRPPDADGPGRPRRPRSRRDRSPTAWRSGRAAAPRRAGRSRHGRPPGRRRSAGRGARPLVGVRTRAARRCRRSPGQTSSRAGGSSRRPARDRRDPGPAARVEQVAQAIGEARSVGRRRWRCLDLAIGAERCGTDGSALRRARRAGSPRAASSSLEDRPSRRRRAVSAWSVWAPSPGSGTTMSMTPSACCSGAVIFIATAAVAASSAVRHRIDGAALRADHRVDRVLEGDDDVADGDRERAAGPALAGDHDDDRRPEPAHQRRSSGRSPRRCRAPRIPGRDGRRARRRRSRSGRPNRSASSMTRIALR